MIAAATGEREQVSLDSNSELEIILVAIEVRRHRGYSNRPILRLMSPRWPCEQKSLLWWIQLQANSGIIQQRSPARHKTLL